MFRHFLQVLAQNWLLITLLFGTYVLLISGNVGANFGVPNLFRDPVDLVRSISIDWTAARNSPVFNTFLFAPALAATLWTLAAIRTRRNRAERGRPPVEITGANLLFGSGILLAIAFTGFFIAIVLDPEQDVALAEIGRAFFGLIIGSLVMATLVVFAVARRLHRPRRQLEELAIIALPMAGLVLAILIYPRLVPAISILALFMALTLIAYGYINMPMAGKALFLISLVALAIGANWTDHDRFRLPNIFDSTGADYYDRSRRIKLDSNANSSGLCPTKALDAWLDERSTKLPKPKLIIVATSGGAYRAAFWTALTLDKIATREPDLLDDARLLVGASGGMVGAAYHVANRATRRDCTIEDALLHDSYVGQFKDVSKRFKWLSQPGCARESRTCACSDFVNRQVDWSYIAGDSLSPVAQRFIQHDIWRTFWPGPAAHDRGSILEDQWPSLSQLTFDELAAAEATGRAPSLIVSPTILETGQPLWISNLDLEPILKDRRSDAIDFFANFPGAKGRFLLSTAVRMSATFPYVSPPAVLPTDDNFHIGDAGYFDNYGIYAATTYLDSDEVRKWVFDKAAGIILVRIYAFPNECHEINAIDACSETLLDKVRASLGQAMEGFSRPLVGAAAARCAKMKLRNDRALKGVQDQYVKNGKSFDVFNFVNEDKTSLSWYITPKELTSMREQLETARNADNLERLVAAWRESDHQGQGQP